MLPHLMLLWCIAQQKTKATVVCMTACLLAVALAAVQPEEAPSVDGEGGGVGWANEGVYHDACSALVLAKATVDVCTNEKERERAREQQ